MKEKNVIFTIDILKNIINVYFDTFFVFYFFKVANYDVIPLAKYYISLYLFIGIGFILIKNGMKKNLKLPYFRIGISLNALFIANIMILKEDIINYIVPIGILKGLGDGFYHFPKNILNSEKITNEDRRKYSGIINSVNKVVSIIIPLVVGVILTYIDYTNLGKIFFLLFIVMFIVSFNFKEQNNIVSTFDMKKFFYVVKKNSNIKKSLFITFLSGLTYSSGVMGTVITLLKINNFKTNLNLGFVDSTCAAISLIISILYAWKIRETHFRGLLFFSGITSFVSLIMLSINSSVVNLIIYLLIRYSSIYFINLISDYTAVNLSNINELKKELKEEYFLIHDVIYSISRSFGYLILLIVSWLFGMNYINHILIFAGFSLLIEAHLVTSVYKNNRE